MGAVILFQKSYVVSNGKPTLPPAIRRKHSPVWVEPMSFNLDEEKHKVEISFKQCCIERLESRNSFLVRKG